MKRILLLLLLSLLLPLTLGAKTLGDIVVDDRSSIEQDMALPGLDPLLPYERLGGGVERTELYCDSQDGRRVLMITTWYDSLGRPIRRVLPQITETTYIHTTDYYALKPDQRREYSYSYDSLGRLTHLTEQGTRYLRRLTFHHHFHWSGESIKPYPESIEVTYCLADGIEIGRLFTPNIQHDPQGRWVELEFAHHWNGRWKEGRLFWGDIYRGIVVTGMRGNLYYRYNLASKTCMRDRDGGVMSHNVTCDSLGRVTDYYQATGASTSGPLPSAHYSYKEDKQGNWTRLYIRERKGTSWEQSHDYDPPRLLYRRNIFYRTME